MRLQTQSYTNPLYSGTFDCINKIYKTEGIYGFLKGIQSPLYGQAIFNAAQFGIYKTCKDTVLYMSNQNINDTLTIKQYFVAGSLVGAAVSLIESPIDLFKTQLQTQIYKPVDQQQYKTFSECVKYISKHYGTRGWYV